MPRWEDVRPILAAVYALIEASPRASLAAGLVRLARDIRDLNTDGYINAKWSSSETEPPS